MLTGLCLGQSNNFQTLLKLQNSVKTSGKLNAAKAENISMSFAQGKKNTGVAILLSMLLPGMGELYAGNYSSGKYFTAADVSLWGIYWGMDTYGNWQKKNYIAYAASTAGVNSTGKDADYYANIGIYFNSTNYNNDMALQGNFNKMYNSPDQAWSWPSNIDRKNYRTMWSSSEQAHNNLRFVVGALILNRIISVINAVRLVAAHNKNIKSEEVGWNVSFGVQNYETLPTQLKFNFQTNF